jgi:transposase
MSNKNPNREYTKEFIQDMLKLHREENRSVHDVAKNPCVPHSTIHSWKRKYPTNGSVVEQYDLAKEL